MVVHLRNYAEMVCENTDAVRHICHGLNVDWYSMCVPNNRGTFSTRFPDAKLSIIEHNDIIRRIYSVIFADVRIGRADGADWFTYAWTSNKHPYRTLPVDGHIFGQLFGLETTAKINRHFSLTYEWKKKQEQWVSKINPTDSVITLFIIIIDMNTSTVGMWFIMISRYNHFTPSITSITIKNPRVSCIQTRETYQGFKFKIDGD